jgi:AraC-like DNA-binding protein
MTEMLAALVLRGAPHSYTERLDRSPAEPAPAYVRRAEEFMRAHCAEPLRMSQVALAAGCSVRTLGSVFRHFRGKTPLGVLQGIRHEQTYRDLSLAAPGTSVAAIARRYGFTNATRFAAAFRRRFSTWSRRAASFSFARSKNQSWHGTVRV